MDQQAEDRQREVVYDISECRATEVGLDGFVECMCAGPNSCQYALPFGYAFLCKHPRMREIIENTRRTRELRPLLH